MQPNKEYKNAIKKAGAFRLEVQRVDKDDEDATYLTMDGVIGEDFFAEAFQDKESNTPEALRNALADIDTSNVHLTISSPGGDLSDGIAMYEILRDSGKNVTTRLQGLSASAATLIAMAGDKREMADSSMMLVHRAMLGIMGYYNSANFADLQGATEAMDQILISLYVNRSGGKTNAEAMTELMDSGIMNQGTFISAEKAKEMGLITHILESGTGTGDPNEPENHDLRKMKLRLLQLRHNYPNTK